MPAGPAAGPFPGAASPGPRDSAVWKPSRKRRTAATSASSKPRSSSTALPIAALDPAWLRLREAAAEFPSARPVTGPRPTPEALRALDIPALVLLAGQGRAHDAARVAATANRLLPHAETAVLPGVSHHALPLHGPTAAELSRRMAQFLGEAR
ncbi:alpha/beta fold hydrolase [Streptomyces sp. ITFR-6]|uniref:alpha/beta fold hydrolase n=1 Tax=Streptomyces sp. ITFR-6 TaxID=3075197 RepID=UPI0037D9D8C4